ncbi:MAG TPA: caspase family protein [Usitatibacteraceae bacterium]|nr:caspase family protein [Usitatibacteraceae bacterium]HQY46567.1 caspase family protein [Usitatibacteraceae bacterium]HRA22712.1 caspase family protein [Usitatibacteraceae bacterium]
MTTGITSTSLRTLAALAAAVIVLAFAPAAAANGRVALLIGNNAYPSSPLRNAVNDSRDLGAALRELGFRTIVKENTSRADMIAALQEFGRALDGAEAALFFYAGHAMQFKDRNYLIPIDAVMGSEDDVTFFSVEVSQVFDRMERARTRFNFVILDACRDNPFRDTFKVSASGLAQMSGPSGTLIAYATAPGATAADGFGRNGVYTGHILQNIKVPDMPVEVLFRKVRESVERDTKRLQTPWELSSIKGDFVFNSTGRAAAAGAAPAGGPSADVAAQLELQFWKSVQDSSRADDIQAYLDKYPNGVFAALAKNRVDALLGRSRVAAASPAPATGAPAPATAAAGAPAAAMVKSPPAASTGSPAVAKPEPAPPPVAAAASTPAQLAAAAPAQVIAVPPTPGPAPATAAVPVPAAALPPKPKDDQPGREISPGVREVTFADGAVYVGAMRGVQLHGKGRYTSKVFKYDGEFKDGLKHGTGRYEWENGDRYEGTFAEDRPSGAGKYQFANGDNYEGEVKAGVIAGRGTYVTRAGDRIEGSFAGGLANGVGIYRFASGDRYEGEMVDGKLQGKGRYFAKNNDRIEAPFVNGRAHGKGTYFFSNGDRYEGDLKEGAITGVGVYTYASGPKYEGEMANGLPQGKGTFWFVDGSRFEGAFEGGLTRAKGALIRADGSRTDAEIIDGAVKLPG